ncbi:GNAT family N-acetyltransferase [Aneurinibacillus sp. Ricciae_BoGa-3]|uniref:GNAT family N-acetyltransferase n=1 Tax=Aneurinibacillus sp. Ricciae_BoGa-3 TaxID=3022697 RepID=UPI00234273D6|nr:GNAT family N-acetyltransferase [Aneurinibacillus sp. Ricciae_BoGa-3]WCK55553.1 GNAT family N-acetyltransferase [Aneurinibacillus sp. Ricciae_BoGa-3]
MEQIIVRPIQSQTELTEVLDLLASIFPEERSFFENRLAHDSSYLLDTTWVALADGKIASTAQIFPFEVRIQEAKIRVAGVGNVATLPEFRGKGLSKKILLQQVEWMKENGFPLSLLYTEIPGFYEKLGWISVPVSVYRFAREDIADQTGQENEYKVRPFTKEDASAAAAIYNSFNEKRTGTRIRTVGYWQDQLRWGAGTDDHFLLATKEEKPAAYIRFYIDSNGTLHVSELCYEPGAKSAALFLVKEAAWGQPEIKEIQGHFPADHVLIEQMEGKWEVSTDHKAMWNVLDEVVLQQALGGRKISVDQVISLLSDANSMLWPMDKF